MNVPLGDEYLGGINRKAAAIENDSTDIDLYVERYDEDWFRNPRAGSHLTSLACGPAHDDDPITEGAPLALARVFEQALG